MTNVISLKDKKRGQNLNDIPTIKKIIDGKIVEYIDLDSLNTDQRTIYFGSLRTLGESVPHDAGPCGT